MSQQLRTGAPLKVMPDEILLKTNESLSEIDDALAPNWTDSTSTSSSV